MIFMECAFNYCAPYACNGLFLLTQQVDLGCVGVYCSLWQLESVTNLLWASMNHVQYSDFSPGENFFTSHRKSADLKIYRHHSEQ